MSTDKGWDARGYQSRHSYVFEYGESLIDLLDPKPGERILDLGCGAGQLTVKIAARGARVIGMDLSPDMIAQARANFLENGAFHAERPSDRERHSFHDRTISGTLEFRMGDAADFEIEDPVDAVFSNAVLHWVNDAVGAIQSVHGALKPGGRFVLEMGGRGNTRALLAAVNEAAACVLTSPWFYPSIAEYADMLESQGFEVRYATLFERPTKVAGEDGLEDWLKMFGGKLFAGIPESRQQEIRAEVARKLRPVLFRDGNWLLDYRRLRVVAVRG